MIKGVSIYKQRKELEFGRVKGEPRAGLVGKWLCMWKGEMIHREYKSLKHEIVLKEAIDIFEMSGGFFFMDVRLVKVIGLDKWPFDNILLSSSLEVVEHASFRVQERENLGRCDVERII